MAESDLLFHSVAHSCEIERITLQTAWVEQLNHGTGLVCKLWRVRLIWFNQRFKVRNIR